MIGNFKTSLLRLNEGVSTVQLFNGFEVEQFHISNHEEMGVLDSVKLILGLGIY